LCVTASNTRGIVHKFSVTVCIQLRLHRTQRFCVFAKCQRVWRKARIEGDDHPTVLFPRDKDATQSRFAVVNSASRGGFQLSETLRLASGTEQTASDVQPIAIRCRRRRRPAVNRKTVHYLLPAYLTHQPTYTSDVVTKLCRPIDQSSRHGRNRAGGPVGPV